MLCHPSKPLIERVLGEGLSAVVKEAFEKNPQQQVAIKMIKKEKWPRDNSNPENTNSSNIRHMSVTIC